MPSVYVQSWQERTAYIANALCFCLIDVIGVWRNDSYVGGQSRGVIGDVIHMWTILTHNISLVNHPCFIGRCILPQTFEHKKRHKKRHKEQLFNPARLKTQSHLSSYHTNKHIAHTARRHVLFNRTFREERDDGPNMVPSNLVLLFFITTAGPASFADFFLADH